MGVSNMHGTARIDNNVSLVVVHMLVFLNPPPPRSARSPAGWTTEPPAAMLYAVEPVGVARMIPSA